MLLDLAFFEALGMELEGEAHMEGELVDGSSHAPINALGLRHVAFVVDDLDDTLARVKPLGGEVVRNVETYQNMLKTCYVRGPEGMLIELCEHFD